MSHSSDVTAEEWAAEYAYDWNRLAQRTAPRRVQREVFRRRVAVARSNAAPPRHSRRQRLSSASSTRVSPAVIALRGFRIGLDEEADGVRSIYFERILLAKLDERDYLIRE